MKTQLENLIYQLDPNSIYSFAVIGFVVGAAIIIVDWRRKLRRMS